MVHLKSMCRSDVFIAALLIANFSLSVPSFAQRDEAAALNAKATELSRAGKYADAIPLAQRALAIRENTLGPNHPDVALSLNELALFYRYQGRYADAEPLNKRSLAIYEKALGPNHPQVARALNELAELYRNQGRYADAEPLYKRSLAIREKAIGADHRRCRAIAEQPGCALPYSRPLRRRRAALQALAGNPREGARSKPSGCRAVAEQSGFAL